MHRVSRPSQRFDRLVLLIRINTENGVRVPICDNNQEAFIGIDAGRRAPIWVGMELLNLVGTVQGIARRGARRQNLVHKTGRTVGLVCTRTGAWLSLDRQCVPKTVDGLCRGAFLLDFSEPNHIPTSRVYGLLEAAHHLLHITARGHVAIRTEPYQWSSAKGTASHALLQYNNGWMR